MLMTSTVEHRLHRRDRKTALLAVGLFLAANLVRFVLLRDTGDRSVQIDYALIPFAYWGARKLGFGHGIQTVLGAGVALLVIGGDLLDIMARRFNWSHGVVIDYAASMPDLPWPVIGPFVGLGMLAAGLCLVPFAVHRHAFPIWPLGVLVGALLAANALIYSGTRGDLDLSRLTHSFVSHAVTGTVNRLFIGRTLTPFAGSTMAGDLRREAPESLPPQILSVAVESLGLASDPARRTLLRPLLTVLGQRYAVRFGAHRFDGSTLPGEIRELCGLQADGIPNTPALLARLGATCLPARLRRLGYDTQALHGNGPLMYDRRAVYPAMGFNRRWFDADLRRAAPGTGTCPGTAFAGVCDADVYARALSLFDGRRRFVHVLTLDTHLPLPTSGAPACDSAFAGNPGLCRYAQTTEASMRSLGQAVLGATHPPELIVVYGDHAPPFAATIARAQFAPHQVPYAVLTRMPGAEERLIH